MQHHSRRLTAYKTGATPYDLEVYDELRRSENYVRVYAAGSKADITPITRPFNTSALKYDDDPLFKTGSIAWLPTITRVRFAVALDSTLLFRPR